MPFTLAILSDLHFGSPTIPERKGDLADVLLARAVSRFNRWIKPDLVVLLGDCIDDPETADGLDRLRQLKAILDRLECPWLAIPGNHDPEPERFYEVMPRPEPVTDLGPVRLITFLDPGTPDYHATRGPDDLARTAAARGDGFGGTVIALHHVPAYPDAWRDRLVFGYTNAADVLDAMRQGRIDLAIGGHCHTGTGVIDLGPTRSLCVDALCQTPHRYTLVTIDGGVIRSRAEALAMPAELGLFDAHGHTQFAYCSANVHTTRSARVAQAAGLAGFAFTEHSGQLYFPADAYWSGSFCRRGIRGGRRADYRVDDYLRAARAAQHQAAEHGGPAVLVGFEVDADFQGRPVLRAIDRHRADLLVGAVHKLSALREPNPDPTAAIEQFQRSTAGLIASGIDALAHPFRIFNAPRIEPPQQLYEWLARLLRQHGVAAEINFHINQPRAPFVRLCLEMGVKLTFAGDAHDLAEIGEFYPHLRLLESLGVADPSPHLADLLSRAKPRRSKTRRHSMV